MSTKTLDITDLSEDAQEFVKGLTEENDSLSKAADDLVAANEAKDRKIAELEAAAAGTANTDQADVEKSVDELIKSADPATAAVLIALKKSADESSAAAAEAKATADIEKGMREQSEMEKHVETVMKNIGGEPVTSIAKALREAKATLSEESFACIEKCLKAASEQVGTGDLFKSAGHSKSTGAETFASAISKTMEDNPKLDYGSAASKVAKERPDLYAAHNNGDDR